MRYPHFAFTALVSFVLGVGTNLFARAQTWPVRPIKLIVSTGPGFAPDIMARLTADRLSRALGKQVYIENIPGAAGVIGAQAAARAAPDGYTLYFAPASALVFNQFLYKTLPYDASRDFTPVAMICDRSPFAVVAVPALPVKNLSDLIAYGKANPGKLSYAVDVSSGFQVAIGRLLNKRGGLDMAEVLYRSTAQMLQETTSGQPQIAISSLTVSNPLVDDGRLRRLAISSQVPFPGIESPPIAQTLPGVNVDGWFAIVAPRGTPELIIRKLNAEIAQILKDEEIIQKLTFFGLATSGAGTPETTGDFIRAEAARWENYARELDIQAE